MANETVSIKPRIRQFVLDHFPLARKQSVIEDDSPLLDGGIIDSLGVLELVHFIEEAFEIMIADEDLLAENFESITSMAAFVRRKRNGQ
jgi:acyl carrier protein